MGDIPAKRVHKLIDDMYRGESRWVPATLIRLLHDFELAEQAMHDAFIAALQQWARDGIPASTGGQYRGSSRQGINPSHLKENYHGKIYRWFCYPRTRRQDR